MRLVFVADARSTISQGWIGHFVARGNDVHVISSYPCDPDAIKGACLYQRPIAFSSLSRVSHNGTTSSWNRTSRTTNALANLRVGRLSGFSSKVRDWLSPIELYRHVHSTRELISRISPDLVHALRIPFEGILAARSVPDDVPLMVSVWGNDFTLMANSNPILGRQTRSTLHRVDALLCDCRRDRLLASISWGMDSQKPAAVLPGSGGVQPSLFYSGDSPETRAELNISNSAPVVINPRGFRAYVRQEVFFQSIPLILKDFPDAIFVCTGMQGNPLAERWIIELAIHKSVRLLPVIPHSRLGDLFRIADISLSPSEHDGTPNSLLEAMACGCFPVAGDLESVREWITNQENGLLCDPKDSKSIARAVSQALGDKQLRTKARESNIQLIIEKAEYSSVMSRAEEFYREVVRRNQLKD